jgi:hypothetical protein
MTVYERSKMWRDVTERNGVQGKECVYCRKWKPLVGGYTKGPYAGYDHRCRECKQVKRIEREPTASVIDDTPRQPDYAIMQYNGTAISFEPDCSAVCITEMWRADGSPENKRPNDWLALTQTKELLAQYTSEFDTASNGIRMAQRNGSDGRGTWLPRELALAYAHYLSPSLYLACNRFVLNRGQTSQAPAQLREMLRDALKDTAHELLEEMRPWWGSIKQVHTETLLEVRGVVYLCKYPRFAWQDAEEYYNRGWDRYAIGWTTKLSVEERLKEYPGKYDIACPEEVYAIKTDNSKLEGLIHERRPKQGVAKVPHKRDVFWLSPEMVALLKALPEHLSYEEAKKRLYHWAIVRKGSDIKW